MLRIRMKVGALIRRDPETQESRKRRREAKKRDKQAQRTSIKQQKAEQKSSGRRQHNDTPILPSPGSYSDWGFNGVLENHNTPTSDCPARIKDVSDSSHTPQHQHQSSNNQSLPPIDTSPTLYPQRLSQSPLRITNGAPSPESPTESFHKRYSTIFGATQEHAYDVHPLNSTPSVDFRGQDDVFRSAESATSNRISDVQEPERGLKIAGYDALREHQRDVRAASLRKLREALGTINPLSGEDAPPGGIPTLHGDGSRFHQYSQPVTFGGSRRSDECVQAGELHVTAVDAVEPDSVADSHGTAWLQPVVEDGKGEQSQQLRPPRPTTLRDNVKRQGRVFYDSELPASLRIGYIAPADRPTTPLSPREEDDIRVAFPGNSNQATQFCPPPRLPTPFFVRPNPSVTDLTKEIDGSILRRRAEKELSVTYGSRASHRPISRRASNTSTISREARSRWSHYLSRQDDDPRLKRNGSAELLSLPGHYGTGHYPLPSGDASFSLRDSVLSSSTDSTETKSLRNKLIQTLSEHGTKYHRNSDRSMPDNSSNESLFTKVAEIMALPGHHGRAFADGEPLAGPSGTVAQGVRNKKSSHVLRREPSHEDLRHAASLMRRPSVDKVAPPQTRPRGNERLSRSSSISSIDMLKDMGRGIKKAAKVGWRRIFNKGRGLDAQVMDKILLEAISPALEDKSLGVDFEKWGR